MTFWMWGRTSQDGIGSFCIPGVSKKVAPKKTFWNIFTSVKSYCVKFCKFVSNSYSHNRSENIPKSFREGATFF